ncbi:MAG TPA: DegT/DnrJ/EryC1/StrS family aminotransferase [Dehalococcoidia bacterium]|nr:DegT/DnrJ/EryC1/StrS family aminotransferase [Dehalococcoidia bacterium]
MIPLVDITKENLALKEELEAALARVLQGGHFILGPEVEAFEAEFAAYCGSRYGIAVSSGTEALRLSLQALDLQPGDEVITVSFTAFPTIIAVLAAGAVPVLVDIDPETYVMDVGAIAEAISDRTRAIIPVHLFGHAVDMDPLLDLARSSEIALIEDACQAHGAEYRGRKLGALGHLGCFSFYPTKNLAGLGDGGIILTSDSRLAERLHLLRNMGQDRRFHHAELSSHSRFDDLQAAILRVKLPYLDGWNARRREIALFYDERLPGDLLRTPVERSWAKHNYHRYVVSVDHREGFMAAMADAGIGTDVYYPIAGHLQPALSGHDWRAGDLSASEQAAETVVALPLYPELTDAEVERVVEAARAAATTTSGRV